MTVSAKRILGAILAVQIFASSAICAMAADVVLPANVKTIKASQLVAPPYNVTAADTITFNASRLTIKLDTDLAVNQIKRKQSSASNDLVIEGTGTLAVACTGTVINNNGVITPPNAIMATNLTINSGNVVATSSVAAVSADKVTINGGNIIFQANTGIGSNYLTVNGGNTVVYGGEPIHSGTILINGGSLTATTTKRYANSTASAMVAGNINPKMTIKGGTLILEAPEHAVLSYDVPITVAAPATIIEPAGGAPGVYKPGLFTINNANGAPARRVVIQTAGATASTPATTPAAGAALIDGFDATFYAALYPDVVAVFGTDPAALYNHYVKYGKKEGRFPNLAAVPK